MMGDIRGTQSERMRTGINISGNGGSIMIPGYSDIWDVNPGDAAHHAKDL